MRTISTSKPVARKNYGCDACVWITEGILGYDCIDDYNMTFAELRSIVRAKQNGWRIMKGQKHLQATIESCDGDLLSWRAIPEIDEICKKYEIYVYEDVC